MNILSMIYDSAKKTKVKDDGVVDMDAILFRHTDGEEYIVKVKDEDGNVDEFHALADDESQALDVVVAFLTNNNLSQYYYTEEYMEETFGETLKTDGASKGYDNVREYIEEQFGYVYIDARNEGAMFPVYINFGNIQVEEVAGRASDSNNKSKNMILRKRFKDSAKPRTAMCKRAVRDASDNLPVVNKPSDGKHKYLVSLRVNGWFYLNPDFYIYADDDEYDVWDKIVEYGKKSGRKDLYYTEDDMYTMAEKGGVLEDYTNEDGYFETDEYAMDIQCMPAEGGYVNDLVNVSEADDEVSDSARRRSTRLRSVRDARRRSIRGVRDSRVARRSSRRFVSDSDSDVVLNEGNGSELFSVTKTDMRDRLTSIVCFVYADDEEEAWDIFGDWASKNRKKEVFVSYDEVESEAERENSRGSVDVDNYASNKGYHWYREGDCYISNDYIIRTASEDEIFVSDSRRFRPSRFRSVRDSRIARFRRGGKR